MIRMQVQLTEEQVSRLRDLAAARRESISAVIRAAVERFAAASDLDAKWERALRVRAFPDLVGPANVSEEHDEYFVEAIEARWRS